MISGPLNNLSDLPPEEEQMNSMLKWWNYVRWLSTITFLSVGIIQMSLSGASFSVTAFILTLVAITLLNIAYSLWIKNFKYNLVFPIIHNFMDIIIFSLAIFMTGGIHSPFLWGYLIPILTSSITIGIRAGFLASMFSVVALLIVAYFTDQVALSPVNNAAALNVYKWDSKTILSFVCLFLMVYFISSFLANTLRVQNNHLKNLNLALREKNEMIVNSQKKLLEMERRDTIYQTALTLQHEINNPLTILSLNTEMLAKETAGLQNERLIKITDSVQRIARILGQIRVLHSQTIKTRDALSGCNIIDLENIESVNIE
ncbi:MAG TPA: HAMP domain-containing histidine kinase [bacterium]|nr:HAMP domain-containing histidine kinase [bacterium]